MITARINKGRERDTLLLVLEPGNLEKMKLGQSVKQELTSFIPELGVSITLLIAFTPDMQWVKDEFSKGGDLLQVLQDSLTRPEVYLRPYHGPEIQSSLDIDPGTGKS
jgi:hypothetical protein